MKVKFQRNTVAAGQPVGVGEVRDLSDAEARMLINLGKAVPAGDQSREPEVEHRDESVTGNPVPEKRTRRSKSALA